MHFVQQNFNLVFRADRAEQRGDDIYNSQPKRCAIRANTKHMHRIIIQFVCENFKGNFNGHHAIIPFTT